MDFQPINERISYIRMKGRFFNTSFVCTHAPHNARSDEDKEVFYETLTSTYDKIPKHDVKVILGDFNSQVGKEEVYGSTIGKYSIHNDSNDNGIRLIDFATSKNLIIRSTFFPHKRHHLVTWKTHENQIDHVLIDGRHFSNILDVRSCRGASVGNTDHFLVRVKYRSRISNEKKVENSKSVKWNVESLRTNEIKIAYQRKISELMENKVQNDNVEELWNEISKNLQIAAQSELGKAPNNKKADWYDEECVKIVAERDKERQKYLRNKTLEAKQIFERRSKEASKILRRKKRMAMRQPIIDLEQLKDQHDVRKFYRNISDTKKGYQESSRFCKSKNGELIGGRDGVLKRWSEYFGELLNPTTNISQTQISINSVEGERVPEPEPTLEEIKSIIQKLKNNTSPGIDSLNSELFKCGGDEVYKAMYELILLIWRQEKMPEQWNKAIIVPIHKKGDKKDCNNYRGISLLPAAYKIFSAFLASRLNIYAEKLIGEYQTGFRRNRSTSDQIFSIRQIQEKCWEYNIELHELFVDFMKAYDSIFRKELIKILYEFGIPEKIIRLIQMTLSNTECVVRIGEDMSESFLVLVGLKQGDNLSTTLFNLALESVMRLAKCIRAGNIFYKSNQILAYADDTVFMGRNRSAVEEVFVPFEREAEKIGLKISEEKTKYMIVAKNKQTPENIKIGQYNFEIVKSFKYLGSTITDENKISMEVMLRIMMGNRCLYALYPTIKCKQLSYETKIIIYKTIIRPVVTYGSETWTLTKADENKLVCWERKILRSIFGPINDRGLWRRRMNFELRSLYRSPDIIGVIKSGRLRWAGHVHRMEPTRTPKVLMEGKPAGDRSAGRPRSRWEQDVEEDARQLNCNNWKKAAEDRSKWNVICEQAKALNGQ